MIITPIHTERVGVGSISLLDLIDNSIEQKSFRSAKAVPSPQPKPTRKS
jgi:hypothetical protein